MKTFIAYRKDPTRDWSEAVEVVLATEAASDAATVERLDAFRGKVARALERTEDATVVGLLTWLAGTLDNEVLCGVEQR